MKRLFSCLVIGIVCAALGSLADSREPEKQTKIASETLPAKVCTALEAYVARVTTARSLTDKAKRQAEYDEAKARLATALRSHNRTDLLAEAALFASYSEQVVQTDATDPKLPGLLDKRAKARQRLLGSCVDHMTAR